jgi:hypothetical protein
MLVTKTGSRLWRYGGPIALTPSRSSFARPVSCHFSRGARIKRDDAKKLLAEAIDPSVNRREEPRNGRMARAAAVCSRWTRGQIVVMSGKRRPTRDDLPIRARFIEKPFHHC